MTLLLLFLFPLLSSLLILCLKDLSQELLRKFTFILSLFPLLILAIVLASGGYRAFIETSLALPWFHALSLQFSLASDALSFVFLLLTALVIPFALIAVPEEITHKQRLFYSLVLLVEALLIGFFLARDLVLFTIFFEAMLIPLFLILWIWGGKKSESTAFKFLLYMIGGSALMVLGVLSLFFASLSSGKGTFDIQELSLLKEPIPYASWIFLIFALAFSVKTPLFPFHGWLPDSYARAPFGGSILLSAILSKGGIYGFFRIGLTIFPEELAAFSYYLLPLAIIGTLWGGLAAWAQKDMKRLIAYSSFSHVNFILAGFFAVNEIALSGSLLQAFNHGITVMSLFLMVGLLYERLHHTGLDVVSGLAQFMPNLCWLTLFFVLASIALPGTSNFIGEFLILYGVFLKNPVVAALLGLSVILSAIYMLRWMQKTYFESPSLFKESWVDIHFREILAVSPLIVIILWIGIYPSPMIELSQEGVKSPKKQIEDTKNSGFIRK